jgi:hypothetical protein
VVLPTAIGHLAEWSWMMGFPELRFQPLVPGLDDEHRNDQQDQQKDEG